ncbi:hypothetical protein [Anaerotignum sp.]|uniref:hypothetical protein n=1 Tax=Anaerotignum sp. TaxID=2039241 RepID=UPI002714FAD8|nr:hypothetical protein [Anaerotignum sp.]
MQLLFTGMIFIFIDFSININTAVIGLIPDFVGYIFIYKGLLELTQESPHFQQALPLSKIMIAVMSVLYAMDVLSITTTSRFLAIPLGMITTALALYTIYQIVRGVLDIEISKKIDLFGENLFFTWKMWAVFTALSTIPVLIPGLSVIFGLLSLIMAIILLGTFYKTKTQFYAQPKNPTHETNL